jgi:hypothetical protein
VVVGAKAKRETQIVKTKGQTWGRVKRHAKQLNL